MIYRLARVQNVPEKLLENMQKIRQALNEEKDQREHEHVKLVSDTGTGRHGRPVLNIPQETLERLLVLHFPVSQIAKLLGVSERTVWNRMALYDLRVRDFYTHLSDQELDEQVLMILQVFPNSGYKQMLGHLRAKGLRITTNKVQESMRRVDPSGVMERSLQLRTIKRRKYNVPHSNALWHMDSHHKLIR